MDRVQLLGALAGVNANVMGNLDQTVVLSRLHNLHSWLDSRDTSWGSVNFMKFNREKCRACTWDRASP